MTKIEDIRKKSDKELNELITQSRQTIRQERFKDTMSRKASVIKNAKTDIARALTERNARLRKPETK
jgi:ribosomal protein L29